MMFDDGFSIFSHGLPVFPVGSWMCFHQILATLKPGRWKYAEHDDLRKDAHASSLTTRFVTWHHERCCLLLCQHENTREVSKTYGCYGALSHGLFRGSVIFSCFSQVKSSRGILSLGCLSSFELHNSIIIRWFFTIIPSYTTRPLLWTRRSWEESFYQDASSYVVYISEQAHFSVEILGLTEVNTVTGRSLQRDRFSDQFLTFWLCLKCADGPTSQIIAEREQRLSQHDTNFPKEAARTPWKMELLPC